MKGKMPIPARMTSVGAISTQGKTLLFCGPIRARKPRRPCEDDEAASGASAPPSGPALWFVRTASIFGSASLDWPGRRTTIGVRWHRAEAIPPGSPAAYCHFDGRRS